MNTTARKYRLTKAQRGLLEAMRRGHVLYFTRHHTSMLGTPIDIVFWRLSSLTDYLLPYGGKYSYHDALAVIDAGWIARIERQEFERRYEETYEITEAGCEVLS